MTRRIGGSLWIAATLMACNAGGDAVATAGDTGSESATDSPPTSVTGSGTTLDETSGLSGTGGTGDENDDDLGDSTGPSDPSDEGPGTEAACLDIDCSPGNCYETEDGSAACECPAPLVAAGLQCLTCTAVEGDYDIDVTATDITVSLLFGGQQAPQIGTEVGELWLRNPATGEMIALGTTHSPTLSARVVPTGYQIVYRRVTGALIPANRDAVVGVIDAKGMTRASVELDLAIQRLEGEIRFDGVAAPADDNENGRLWLRKAGSADEVFLGETKAGSFGVYVLPGTYWIEFESLTSGAFAPRNHRARVGSVEISAAQAEVPIMMPVDIPTEIVSGAFLVDDAPAPKSATERARVSLRDTVTGDEILLGETNAGDYSLRIVPGSYEIVYEWVVGSAVMPANSYAVIGSIDTTKSTANDIQIQTVTVSGGFTIDGAAPPSDAADDGRISLHGAHPDDEILLGNTTSGGFERIVLPGVYNVHYAQDTSSLIAPANSNARLETVDVGNVSAFDINVPTAFVSGIITLGDGAPPDSDYDDGWVFLRNATSGDTVLLANTRMGQFAAPVVPGTYEVVYAVETPGGQVPINIDSVVLDTVDVVGGTVINVDIPVNALAGNIDAGGRVGERGALYLTAVGAVSRALLGNTADSAYQQPVMPGRYVVSYGVETTNGGLPVNTNAPLSCIELFAAD
jgi:hypothetical protein